MKQKLLALAIFSALAMGASTATLAATSYTPFGNTSIAAGGHPGSAALLVSDGSNANPYGGVRLASTTVTTLSSVTSLGTDYQRVAGDCGGGSPRFSIRLPADNGLPAGNIFVYIGTPPSFTCAAGWQTTDNLLTGPAGTVDTSQIGGTVNDTWAGALSLAGSRPVSSISIVVDAGWSQPGGVQTVRVDNVKVNGDIVGFAPDTTMVIPLVAQTATYTSEITVRNPYGDMALPVSVFYTGASGTSAAGGPKACTPLSVPPQGTVQFALATQCNLPSGSQFGYVTLTESTGIPSPFVAYSRAQTVGGNGFSVPAYPVGTIEVPAFGHYAIALKRQAAAPTYQSNCFVASLNDATDYHIQLRDAEGKPIGIPVTGNLQANQMVRHLDIFAAAQLPPGDHSNVSADFSNGPGKGEAPLFGLCTVQENTFFGADFRLAQPPKTWRYDLD